MNDKEKQDIGLFKFSLIAPLINDTYEASSKMAYYRNIASKTHTHPNGKKVQYSSGAIKNWHLTYLKKGIDGLLPKSRSDTGMPRAFSAEAADKIHDIKDMYPYITTKMVYQKLVEENYIKASDVSLASVYRYTRDHQLKRNQVAPIERRAYEMEFANDCWQGDTSHGPRIMIQGKKVKTFLISLIDDKSRLITHAEFFLHDNAINLQSVFKKAIKKYGVPKKLFVDNGGPYKNHQFNLICASLGVLLIHARPYSGASKGKIERSFRTIKDNFMHCTDWNDFESLEHLNAEFNHYLDKDYQNHVHSSIQSTPKNSFLQDTSLVRYKTEEDIDNSFLHRVTRKVRNDATISINTTFFEVPQAYIGQRILLRYSPLSLSEIYIYDLDNQWVETVYPLKKIDNSKVKRATPYPTNKEVTR